MTEKETAACVAAAEPLTNQYTTIAAMSQALSGALRDLEGVFDHHLLGVSTVWDDEAESLMFQVHLAYMEDLALVPGEAQVATRSGAQHYPYELRKVFASVRFFCLVPAVTAKEGKAA